jgi:uncharacterized protein (TIGR03435 family)
MAGLAANFNSLKVTDRTVIDRTGLPGRFAVDLQWTPLTSSANPAPSDPADAADLFTAIREQLGLKLEPTTEMMDVIVIDHIELPEPN